jgi:hypothetical protein
MSSMKQPMVLSQGSTQRDATAGHQFPDTTPSSKESAVHASVNDHADTCFDDGDLVTGWLLEWFSPFNELTDTQRDIIAGYETIRKIRAGTCLFEDGVDDDSCIYLVEGTLALTAADGETIRVRGGTRRSRLPISALTPHAHTVTAISDASIVVFNHRLIQKITEITRTYTGIDRPRLSESSTQAISNRMQAIYLSHVDQ